MGIGRRGRDRRGGARRGAWPTPRSSDQRSPTSSVELAGLPFDGVRETVAMRPTCPGWPPRTSTPSPSTPRRRIGTGARRRTTPSCRSRCRARPRRSTSPGRRLRSSPPRGVVLGTVTSDAVDRWTALALTATAADLVGYDARRHRPDLRLRHGSTPVRSTGRIVPSSAAPAGRRRRPPRGIPCFAAARRVGRRRARTGGRARRCRLGQGVRLPRRARGARDRHPGPRRHRQHVGVPGARLPAPVPAVHRRVRRSRSQPGARARARRKLQGGT